MREDVAFTLSDREWAFAGVHASEVLFDGKVLAKTGCEASDTGSPESCDELARAVIPIRHVCEVLALDDEVFFCESCHGHSGVRGGEPFPILFMFILYYRFNYICTIV